MFTCMQRRQLKASRKTIVIPSICTRSNDNYAGISMMRELTIIEKVTIMCDDDSILPPRGGEYIFVAVACKSEFNSCSGVEA